MEIEAEPLLCNDDQKLGNSIHTQRLSTKGSRLWSWAVPLMTHGLVALLVLFAVSFSLLAGLLSHHELQSAKARPSLYCAFEDGR